MATVLIVEDDQMTRSMLTRLLTINGYRTIAAESGTAALELCKMIKADVILLDLMMPELDGVMFLQRLREMEDWKNTPVIVMSALDEGPLVTRARELGIQGYFVKAHTPYDQLLARIAATTSPDPGN